jgi:hypothetical protein
MPYVLYRLPCACINPFALSVSAQLPRARGQSALMTRLAVHVP